MIIQSVQMQVAPEALEKYLVSVVGKVIDKKLSHKGVEHK